MDIKWVDAIIFSSNELITDKADVSNDSPSSERVKKRGDALGMNGMEWSGMEWNGMLAFKTSPFESPSVANLPYQFSYHFFFNSPLQKLFKMSIEAY